MNGSGTIGESVPSKSVSRPAGSAASASGASASARDSDASVWRLDSGTVKRLSSWALPIILGVAGVALIIIGSLDLRARARPRACRRSPPHPGGLASPTAIGDRAAATAVPPARQHGADADSDARCPTTWWPSSSRSDRSASTCSSSSRPSAETDSFPPPDAAYILRSGHQPGRNTNSYIFAHALNSLFKPLWNVQIGAEVLIRMSDDSVLRYVVTEVRPNVACPDPDATTNSREDFGVTRRSRSRSTTTARRAPCGPRRPTYERLTLQTSQGYNRNWGELVVIARARLVGLRWPALRR